MPFSSFSGEKTPAPDGNTPAEQPGGADVAAAVHYARSLPRQAGAAQNLHLSVCKHGDIPVIRAHVVTAVPEHLLSGGPDNGLSFL